MNTRETSQRNVGVSAALVAGGVGIVTGNPTVFMVAAVALVYAAYQAAIGDPEPTLTVERHVDPADPLPGSEVTVTLTLTNGGDATLPDVRVLDGVPERLEVVGGSPRFGTHLEAGASDSVTYTVEARRGDHAFTDVAVVCRNLTGTVEFAEQVPVETTLSCSASVDTVPLSGQTLAQSGRVPTNAGGNGLAFYAIREHQSTDPMSRVDWNRLAKTNELATVEFKETRAATVITLVDSRHHVAGEANAPTAVQFCAYAARQVGSALLGMDNRVGAAIYDSCETLQPSANRAQEQRLEAFLSTVVSGAATGSSRSRGSALLNTGTRTRRTQSPTGTADRYGITDGGDAVATLDRSIPSESQVVFCTPLLDDRAADAAKRLAAYGHAVTVVSPDMTTGDSPGSTVERIDRTARLDGLRGTVRVVDWTPAEPLAKALIHATERWA
ncbi:DUF58 domain-containing protein [Haloarcula sp. CBA1130]|uniref:DUF58 domain-containing protein n=1 Tax=unclassified Haloarcula TaxID=2624677 RepID=UPI00124664FE|nr:MULTISPECIES: DUF58 domain-containing protein [unclassified Haloarcula]KAA9398746.1 DUF58 domain-containing protein [Haloarcula sp. CBA1129]KAA9403261.1 DUF58 domain-containing protein [Haloarcula sp. CBA1130]